MVARVGTFHGSLGGGHGEVGAVAAAVFPTATGHRRSPDRGLGTAGCGHFRLAPSVDGRLFSRRDGGLRDRCGDRLVAACELLDPSDVAFHRTSARDGVAAIGLLRVPLELQRQHFSDRARHRVPGRGAHLVRRSRREQHLLRRCAHIGRQSALSCAQSRHSGGNAACFCRPVHGSGQFFCGAGGRRDAGGKGGSRLVPAMGAGLGCLCQHVCGTVDHGVLVLGSDHTAVPAA